MRVFLYVTATLSMIMIAPVFADGGRFEVEPEVGEWQEQVCYGPENNAIWSARCSAQGGDFQGPYSGGCVGGNLEAYRALPAEEQAERWADHFWNNVCDGPHLAFSGWGNPTHNASVCGISGPQYSYGILSRETGNIQFTGSWTFESQYEPLCSRQIDFNASTIRVRVITCPEGSRVEGLGEPIGGPNSYCYKECPADQVVVGGQCVPPEKPFKCGPGNPCDPRTGVKFQTEQDFNDPSLSFSRYYSSTFQTNVGMGVGWNNQWSPSLSVNVDKDFIYIVRKNRGEVFRKFSGQWQGDIDSDYALTEDLDGTFTLFLNKGSSENYSADGRLLSTVDAKGNETLYSYVDGKLSQVTNHYGKSISFTYTEEVITQVVDALGNVYRYAYDTNNNLIAVTYPDATPVDDSDNPIRTYHYEDANYPNHLTGVTDENGDRYSTFAYDAEGKAILTEHAQTINSVPQERFQLNYQN